MTETNCDGDENLKQITETFFRRIVTVNKEYALIVFRSSLALLPEAETTAFLVSKCIEALSLRDGGYGAVELFDEVVRLGAEDFTLVAESMSQRFTNHDVIYEIVDLYLQVYYIIYMIDTFIFCYMRIIISYNNLFIFRKTVVGKWLRSRK